MVDWALYRDGVRKDVGDDLDEALRLARTEPDAFLWIGLVEPELAEFDAVAREFDLHPLAVEDAVNAHQRPKLEEYDETLFVVLKTAVYDDRAEAVRIGEVTLFLGRGFVVTVRHGAAATLHDVRLRLEGRPDLLRHGAGAVLHAVMDRVVDDYDPVLRGLEHDVEQIEDRVFSPERTNDAERIYRLKRQVLHFRRAVVGLTAPLEGLVRGGVPCVAEELEEYFRDVQDHVLRDRDAVDGVSNLLDSILDANLAQVGLQQNDDQRKISAWAAIALVPTVIAGIYGMNFQYMPELSWRFGYPMALGIILTVCVLLHRAFRRNGWL